ncbi:tetraspanin-9-like [Saccostrea echinata]|uniref:tetraspanin-9-like n=1 Tax=Saccostrea echinata TaxID=191078 RepID=UPI002A804546|nr:tetraspanin-9-like [Saccostrea echinata]
MGFFTGVGRFIVVILNIIFVIVSTVMLASGIALKFFSDNAFLKNAEEQFKSGLDSFSSKTGAGIDTSSFSLNSIFGTVSIVLIVFGAFLLAVSFFGCCGACCKVQVLLIVYAVILIVLLLGQIILVILMYASPVVKNSVREELKVSVKDYQGVRGVNLESMLWNAAMIELKCCGVEDYKDFGLYAKSWNNTPAMPDGTTDPLSTPVACCVTIPTSKSAAETCAKGPTLDPTKNNYNKGCFDKIWDMMFENPLMLGIVLSVAFVIQLLLIVFTIMMYKQNKGEKNGKGTNKVKPMRGYM